MLRRPLDPTPRPLAEVVGGVPGLATRGEIGGVLVTGCTHDSRQVRPGDLYAALPGANVHGARFAADAVAAGAAAVLTDPSGAELVEDGPVVVAERPRDVLGEIAAAVHGHPARALTLLGVTGTNGKTTTSFMIDAGLRAAGRRTGLLGTVVTRIGDEQVASARTTPEATDLHALFAVMRESGVDAATLEVSSHALALGRVDGVVFDVATFLNLSQDHLDFHAGMEDYFAAKASLFTPRRARRGIVNQADAAGRRLLAEPAIALSSFGPAGDWSASEVELGADGSTFRLRGPGVDARARVQLPGGFNVDNAVAALASLVTAGIDLEAALAGVGGLPNIPGRMERVDAGQPFLAVVDFAHTPEAVAAVLREVRAVIPGRVIVVLGCGGDRDRGKRPLMGLAAVEGADLAILTSDNPRSEDPLAILEQMAQPAAVLEPDRRAAIALAVAQARPGDAVVVAGKGHESGQEVAGVVTPFDDRDVLRAEILAAGA